MLGPFGETLVVDWGLAKVIGRDRAGTATTDEPTLQPASAGSQAETVAGTALGTPGYMSPEQAAGRLDDLGPASDVYSLGATLYAVLAGRAPFEGADLGEVLRQAQRGDFPPPRQVQPRAAAALDAVCRKAMALSPGARYSTPLALAAEVERWLADEPVHAYRDPLAVRLVRWGRRHQQLVAGGTALLLTAVLALAVGLGAVERQRKQTAAAKEQAEEHFTLAKEAVDHYLTAVAEDQRLKEKDLFALRQKLLETAVPFYERFAQAKAGDPEQEAARGRAYFRLGQVRAQMGEREAALADYEQMRSIFARLVADSPAVPQYRQNLAAGHTNLGILLRDLGKRPEAEEEYRRALALRDKLATDFPTLPAYRQDLAGSHTNLGNLLANLGKRPEAEAHSRRAIALQEQLAADCPIVPKYCQELAGSYGNFGRLPRERGEAAASLPWFDKARAALRSVLEKEPRLLTARRSLRNVHMGRAQALNSLGRHTEAVAEWEQTLALNDDKPLDRGFRVRQYWSLARAGQPAAAVAAVEELLQSGNAASGAIYDASCVCAVAAAQAAKAAPPHTSSLRAEQYALRSVELLRQAVQTGYKDVAHIKKDTDLDALRPRPDFQHLLAGLEAKAPGK
jgi:serine/threonine-protein kinase